MVRKIAYLILGLSILLGSCSTAPTQTADRATSTIMPTGVLTPYFTPTKTPEIPTSTLVVTIPVTPSPTPTPFLHTITEDDTMGALAFRYGVKLEDLKTANPNVNPNAMSVGSQLVIPINKEIPEVLPTPTTLPLQVGSPRCYKTGDAGAWCIVPVLDDTETSLENLSVWIGLYNLSGENFISQVAFAPLNILRPGSTMPLMVYFPPPLPDIFTSRSELVSALAVSAGDERYLDAQAKVGSVKINSDGSQASVSGEVVLAQDAPAPSQVWVLTLAYDQAGNILGVRKWKSGGETHFDTTVYSLGGVIDHVEVLVEVRP